ncbi:hypothetical protein GCM10027275_24690 [Rhabdobacter roseus]|uniref:XRE family transcriptional regulator n=1 Tax=Rhabdobacter roseus TaxID=1655419 RepID=A0A840TXN5_9BACT|nr:hypothetical protein [Rhabdobacter roseus]MBB5284409.1 hypothetical protein [Rhabdobacter roseus]
MTDEQKYKIIKAKHKLIDKDIAGWFGYSSVQSFNATLNGKRKIIAGVVKLYEHLFGTIE